MSNTGPILDISGVTFESVQMAITDLYFRHKGMNPNTQEGIDEFKACMRYVVPMQHNWENPIEPGSQDTWIQYWIDDDDRLTHDRNNSNFNAVQKLASITLRFLGVRAEQWAKSFHHLTKHRHSEGIFAMYCNAMLLPYVSPIIPRNVDYFGVGNTTKAFTLSFKLQYDELLDFSRSSTSGADRLEYISFAVGQMSENEKEGS